MMHIEEPWQCMSTDASVVKVTPNFVTRKKDRAFLVMAAVGGSMA